MSLDDVATALGRLNKVHSPALRWAHFLQPWIMQHYAGTLNLDIRMMLVNHLAETYHTRESIDWDAVASKSEFAGNTTTYLQYAFGQVIGQVKKSLNTKSSYEWEQIIVKCREHINKARSILYNSE